jgi:hypothetical protein
MRPPAIGCHRPDVGTVQVLFDSPPGKRRGSLQAEDAYYEKIADALDKRMP